MYIDVKQTPMVELWPALVFEEIKLLDLSKIFLKVTITVYAG